MNRTVSAEESTVTRESDSPPKKKNLSETKSLNDQVSQLNFFYFKLFKFLFQKAITNKQCSRTVRVCHLFELDERSSAY
jgi:hypothetical protein